MVAGRASDCVTDSLAYLMAANPTFDAEPRRDAPAEGLTLPSRHGHSEPRLPHERDESSDSHPGTEDERIKQAARDLVNGQQDTGRTPVVTELARREFPSDKEKPRP